MSKCTYTYKGKDYSREELETVLIEERVIPQPTGTQDRLVISGNEKDLINKEMALRGEAIRMFGTDEFIHVQEEDGKKYVSIDQKAISDLTSGERTLINNATGQPEAVNMETLWKQYQRTGEFPNYRYIEDYLEEHVMTKIQKGAEERVLSQKDPKSENLESRLLNFANRLGISVTSLENYKERYGLRAGENVTVEALADMMRRIIALANNSSIGQLTEEVSHFAIEYFDDKQQIDTLLDAVINTDKYREQSEKYRVIYAKDHNGTPLSADALERKVRKEVLGQILADSIEQNFAKKDITVLDTIIESLKGLWDSLMEALQITDANKKFFKDFGQVLDQLAQDVVDGNMKKFTPQFSNEIYFSAMTPEERRFQDALLNHVEQLKQNYRRLTSSAREKKDVKIAQLKRVTDELTNMSYYTALNSYLSVMAEDVNGAKNTIETAKTLTRGQGSFVRNIDNIDRQNLNNFTSGVEPALEAIRKFLSSQLHHGASNSLITKEDLKRLESRVKGISDNYATIKEDLYLISEQLGFADMERILDEYGVAGALRKTITDGYTTNLHNDVNTVVKHFFSAFNVSNPIFMLATAVYKKAETRIRRRVNSFSEKMRALQRKYNFTQKQIESLLEKWHMTDAFKRSDFEEDYYSKDRELVLEYNNKINGIVAASQEDRIAQEEALYRERDIKRNDLMFEWTIPQFRRSYYDKLVGLRPETKDIIKLRTISRNKVFNKYRGRDGRVRYEFISSSDLVKLQEAHRAFKSQMSLFDESGLPKEGVEKKIAQELIDYFERSDFSNVVFQQEEFENTRLSVLRTFGEDSKEYKNWLSLYANVTYTEEDFADFETQQVDIAYPLQADLEIDIRESLGIPDGRDASLQELYEGLLEKRRQLVAPYKKMGQFNEIDGNQIESNPVLREELDRIREYLSKFEILGSEDNPNVKATGNAAYRQTIKRLKAEGKIRELKDFIRKHGNKYREYYDVELGEDIAVPNTYYYRTFIIDNRPPTPQPNFLWIEKDTDTNERNPDFNMAYRGKGIIPNHKNKPEYINKKYFELFGINQDEVLGAGANSLGTPTKNLELWELRQTLLESKEEDDAQIGQFNQYFLLPQVRGDSREVFTQGMRPLKAGMKDSFLLEGDDELGQTITETNQKHPIPITKLQNSAMIPRYYVNKLKNHEDITRNISKMYGRYKEMAVNYEEKSAILPTMLNFRQRLETASIHGGKQGKESNLLSMLDNWFGTVLYGQTHSAGGVVKIGEAEISTTKTAKTLYRYISTVNLGFNSFVPVIGYLNATLTKRLEGVAGNDTTTSSLNWANKEFMRHMPTYINSVGSISPTNRIKKLFEFSGINMDHGEIYDGVFNSKAFRLNKDIAFKHYEAAGTATAAHAILSIYDNYRLFDGNFISFKAFKDLEINKALSKEAQETEWNLLKNKTYYSYIKENEHTLEMDTARMRRDGFSGDFDAMQARINRATLDFHNKVEGLVSIEDRSAIQKHTILMFFAMHRGWLQAAVQQRFKGRHVNIFTGAEEEGNYMTIWRLLGDNWREDGISGVWGLLANVITFGVAYPKAVQGLEEFEQANLRRLKGDGIAYMLGLALFLLSNMAADDDEDDYFKQYFGYIGSRAFSEIMATIPITSPGQVYEIAVSPLAGISMLEDIVNTPGFVVDLLYGGNTVKSGAYEGMEQWQKDIIKKMPIKNIFEPLNSNARRSNLYFRNKVMYVPNKILNNLEELTGIKED